MRRFRYDKASASAIGNVHHPAQPTSGYRWPAIMLHWLIALAVLGLFPLGLYMTELTYYDPLYRTLPFIHRSIGVIVFVLLVLRLAWRMGHAPPRLLAHSRLERQLAMATHVLLYLLLFAVIASGYLMSTADGRPVSVFGWFAVPASVTSLPAQEDLAGDVHFILAIMLVSLVAVHVAGALKHHFLDRDATLLRILHPRGEARRR